MTTVDRIPVAALIQRSFKSRLYRYLKELEITPVRAGNNSFVSSEESQFIEGYHAAKGQSDQAAEDFLRRFKTSWDDSELPEFSLDFETSQNVMPQNVRRFPPRFTPDPVLDLEELHDVSERLETPQNVAELSSLELLQLLQAVAQHFAKQNPLANLEALQKAYEHGWLLSSSQLALLLGVRKLAKSRIERFGFVFERVGRNGPESAWKVSRV